MRASVAAADTAAMIRRHVHVALILAVVTFIGTGFWYSSTQPGRMERILACVDKLGYSAYSYHDDGKEPFDPGLTGLPPGEVQVRPPVTHVIVHIPDGKYEDMTVPDSGDPAQIADRGNPTKAAERNTLGACAN
jgi:hypothetical protein